jgi:hypothetical protein
LPKIQDSALRLLFCPKHCLGSLNSCWNGEQKSCEYFRVSPETYKLGGVKNINVSWDDFQKLGKIWWNPYIIMLLLNSISSWMRISKLFDLIYPPIHIIPSWLAD